MKNEKFKKEKLKNILSKLNIELLDNNYINNIYKHNWKCLKCDNVFVTSLVVLQQGCKCKICFPRRKRKTNDLYKKLNIYNIKLLDKKYIKSNFKHNWKCLKCGYEFKTSWNNLLRRKYKCKLCEKNNKKNNKINLFCINILDKQLQYLNLELLDKSFINAKYKHNWKCLKCGYEFEQTWDKIQQKRYKCNICFPKTFTRSLGEKELSEFIKSLNFSINENDKNVIKPLELDIYIYDKNIAIEFDGLYYHSEKFVNKFYHLNKTELCEKQNIKMIHIFEDEWIFKKEIVKSRLKQILNISNSKRIHARKCQIKEISPKLKNDFLNIFHIQGGDKSVIKLGAFYNNELVSVMTFSHGSISRKKLLKYNWELSRFCSNSNYHIPGIASKLLTYFKRNCEWEEIFSYADRRWSDGNLYFKLGFELVNITKINYWYIKGNNRIHRFNLRKKYHEPKDIPERILRAKEGYYRIWDCGHLKFKIERI